MSAATPERSVTYREPRSALNWPLLTCGLFGPAAGVAICVVLGITVSPQWFPWIVFVLFGLFLAPISLLNRNWPTGIRIDESGISIGAIGSAQAVLGGRPSITRAGGSTPARGRASKACASSPAAPSCGR